MKYLSVLVLLGLAFFLPGTTQAWPFFGGDKKEAEEGPATNATKRYHLLIPDKAAEKELLQLFNAKRVVAAQLQALTLLIEEKRQETKRFDGQLAKAFSVSETGNYRYDPKTRTIYEQVPKDGGVSATNAAGSAAGMETTVVFEQRVHMQLKDDEQVRQFAGLAAGKRVTQEEIQVFNRVSREKQVEMDQLDKLLKDKFSVSRDRNYWYDVKTMRLYEIVDAPKRGALQGENSLQ